MIPYIKSKGTNTITCSCDLAIMLENSEPVLLSLFDYGVKTKKITADFYKRDYHTELTLEDRENVRFSKRISMPYNDYSYMSKSDRQGELTHTIIRSKNIDKYIIDWDNRGKISSIVNYIRNKLYIPMTEEIFKELKAESLITELKVYTNNPIFENLKAYSFNEYWFKSKLEEYKGERKTDNFDWSEIETIQDYIYTFLEPIKDKISRTITPLYNPKEITQGIFEGIKPFKGQLPIIQGGIEVLKRDRFIYVGAEQGSGKTIMGIKINHNHFKQNNKLNYNTLVIAPAITLSQWKEEIERSFEEKAKIITIKKTEDFIKWYKARNILNESTYILIGKETFKLSYATEPSYNKSKQLVEFKEMDSYYKNNYYSKRDYMYSTRKKIIEVLTCPNCGKPLKNPNITSEDKFFEAKDFKKPNKGNYKCSNCDTILWSATYNKTKKTSVIDYIHRKGIKFDSIILDEAHESNNSGSIIGNATRTVLRNHTKKVIALSGTNNNGYASSLHNLFMALCPNKLIKDGCLDVKDFVKKYGTLQAVTPLKDERRSYYSRGKAEIKDSEFKEIEGINPIVFTKYLASNSIFATLDDLKDELPKINEMYIPIKALDQQYYATKNLFDDIKKANCFNAKMYIDSIVKHYINNPVEWDSIEITNGDSPRTVQPQNLYIDSNLPKEDKLIEIVKQEYSEGRKVWIYCDFNNGGDYMKGIPIPKKLKKLLENEGLKVFLLSTSTSTYDRKEIIEQNKNKYDVFICNPRLVNVGINLVFCPTYIFYMPSYRVDIVSQASRRGYRINSSLDNRVYHLYYEGTDEDIIIKRYQRKLAESNAINGRFNVQLEDDKKIRTASQFSSKLNQGL
jgi:superfamily II DNA or RNA helicase